MIAPPSTPESIASWATFAVAIWVKVEQWRNSRKAKEDLDVNTAETKETKDVVTTIKTMLNGEKLAKLKEIADARKLVADYRKSPGDQEAYERALEEYHRTAATQAVLIAETLQAQMRRQS